jgi:hypothetical protein
VTLAAPNRATTRQGRGVFVGLVQGKLLLKNPRQPDLQAVEVEALADTGSVHLCIPQHV